MEIKRLKLTNFKGTKEREIRFTKGLNIIYGKNEAGKSSIVEAVSIALFTSAKSKDRELENFFLNYNKKPVIELEFSADGTEWILVRNFAEEKQSLENKQGEAYFTSDEINAKLQELFGLNRKAYRKKEIDLIKRRFEDLFIIQQENVNISSPNQVFSFLLSNKLSKLPLEPNFAQEKINKALKEKLRKGLDKPAKNPGLIASIKSNLKEKEELLKEKTEKLENLKKLYDEKEEITKELKELETAINRFKEVKEKVKPFKTHLEAFKKNEVEIEERQYGVIIQEIQNRLIKARESFFTLKLADECLSLLEQVFSKFKDKLNDYEKQKNLIDQAKSIQKEMEKIPAEIGRDILTIERLKEALTIIDEIAFAKNELSKIPDLIEKEYEKAKELEISIKKATQQATLHVQKINPDKFKVLVDGEKDLKEPGTYNFTESVEIKNEDLQVFVTLNPNLDDLSARLDQILKKFGLASITEMKELTEKRSVLKHQLDDLNKRLLDLLKTVDELNLPAERVEIENLRTTILERIYGIFKKYDGLIEKKEDLETLKDLARKRDTFEEMLKELEKQKAAFLNNFHSLPETLFPELSHLLKALSTTIQRAKEAIKPKELQKLIYGFEPKLKKYLKNKEFNHKENLLNLKEVLKALEEKVLKNDSSIEDLKSAVEKLKNLNLDSFFANAGNAFNELNRVLLEVEEKENKLEEISIKNLELIVEKFGHLTIDHLLNEIKQLEKRQARQYSYLTVEAENLKEDLSNFDQEFLEEHKEFIEGFDPLDEKALEKVLKLEQAIETKINETEKRKLIAEKRNTEIDFQLGESPPDKLEIEELEDEIEKLTLQLQKAYKLEKALQIAADSFQPAMKNYHVEIAEKSFDEASKIFSKITDNRYEKIEGSFKNGDDFEISVKDANGKTLKVVSLSQGAFDQLYLSLRLALAKAAFTATNFPFFFDETFSDFDDSRLENSLKILVDLVMKGSLNQIIITTCQERILEKIKEIAAENSTDFNLVLLS